MKHSVIIKILTSFVLVVICGSALAEYKAITKFRYCDLMGGCCGTKKDTDYCDDYGKASNDTSLVIPSGNDGVDIEACEAIADNINEMEKASYNWEYGFAISANNFDLTLPDWRKVSENEVCDVLGKNDAKPLGVDCKAAAKYPVYYILYNLDKSSDDERIYIRKTRFSKSPSDPYSIVFWAIKGVDSQPKLQDYITHLVSEKGSYPIVFAKRLYFVEYGTSMIRDSDESIPFENTFVVHAFRFPEKGLNVKEYESICDIRPISK